MAQQDEPPLVFHFAEEDNEPEELHEHKELWENFGRPKSPRLSLPRASSQPCSFDGLGAAHHRLT